VAVEIVIPADRRSVDEALHETRILLDLVATRYDQARIGGIPIVRKQEDIGLEVALPLDRVRLRRQIALLDRMFVDDERRRIEVVRLDDRIPESPPLHHPGVEGIQAAGADEG